MAATATLAAILAESAVPDEAKLYLTARGITTPAIMSAIGADEGEFEIKVIDRFIDGLTVRGVVHKFTGDASEIEVLRATMQVAYQTCRNEYRKALASTILAMTPPSTAGTPSAAATAVTVTPKVPLTLPTGVWITAVNKYNKVQTGGADRSFPCNLLIGAEKVLARIHHEVHISKNFTPVLLGEIMTSRAYTATGQINMMSQKKSDKQELSLEDGQWVAQEPKAWDPNDLMAILDGFESIRWAWILFDMGNEADVNE